MLTSPRLGSIAEAVINTDLRGGEPCYMNKQQKPRSAPAPPSSALCTGTASRRISAGARSLQEENQEVSRQARARVVDLGQPGEVFHSPVPRMSSLCTHLDSAIISQAHDETTHHL